MGRRGGCLWNRRTGRLRCWSGRQWAMFARAMETWQRELRPACACWWGFTSAAGMYLGHFIAWIASGILCAAAMGSVSPGPIAYMGAGAAGAICVVIAGWTTANPTLYRSGLALQVATPNWKRWKVTLVAGIVTTSAACFPALVMKFLDFVALYGLVLMPMGGVIFADYWLFPRFGLVSNHAEKFKTLFSIPAAVAWIGSLAVVFWLPMEIFFKGLPAWFITVILYTLLSAVEQKRRREKEAVS